MKTGAVIAIIIIIIVIGLIVWWAYSATTGYSTMNNYPSSTPTTSTNGYGTGAPTFDQNISDGIITMAYPSSDFGLATTQSQIVSNSTIPPCDANFNYCLYYVGSAYQGTNFLSAGIRIQQRPALSTQSSCLNTEPTGYTGLTPSVVTSTDYATAEFGSPSAPLSNGAAGSYADDVLYRLFYKPSSTCYEFQTRVAQSEYGNYPSGTIQQFTTDDESALQAEIGSILSTLTLPASETVMFSS